MRQRGADEVAEPSVECHNAMVEASLERDPEAADPLLIETLSTCKSADEWLEALRGHPQAMGLRGEEYVGEVDVRAACAGHKQEPVCVDAVDEGLID